MTDTIEPKLGALIHTQGEGHSFPQLENYMKLLLRGPHADLKSGLATVEHLSDPAYLAWEVVRKERAAEIVGEIQSADGTILPYTGFEGYLVGKPPAEIIALEINLGKKILFSIDNYIRSQATSGITEADLLRALHGERFPAQFSKEIITFFDGLFGATLARVKGITSPEEYADFQKNSYDLVKKRKLNGYKPNGNWNYPGSTITIPDPKDLKAYRALAEIGVFGHPQTRKVSKIISNNPFQPKT